MSHTIRLRGPWNLRHPSLDQPVRFRVPGKAPIDAIANDGSVVHSPCEIELVRPFNRPTGLDSQSIVLLCGRFKTDSLSLSVNGTLLFSEPHRESEYIEARGDVAGLLKDSNMIVARCTFDRVDGSEVAIDDVWLEID